MSQNDERKFDPKMLEALVCPQCQGRLNYDAATQALVSSAARLAYPIRGGIPVLLIDEARVIDRD
ncbi:MAG: Trm112 family protein [Octadecabacter sp.]|nr:Trm112 family protein [Octadecabacter sp.]